MKCKCIPRKRGLTAVYAVRVERLMTRRPRYDKVQSTCGKLFLIKSCPPVSGRSFKRTVARTVLLLLQLDLVIARGKCVNERACVRSAYVRATYISNWFN